MRKTSAQVCAAALIGALLIAGCGGGDEEDPSAAARPTERAFMAAMVPHHEEAIEMATIAKRRGDEPLITRLADDIITAQRREIAQLERIHQRLFRSPLKPDRRAHDRLGLSAEEAGMAHSEADMERLRAADPFDREFVDMMVPHHAGAIRMAEAVLANTRDPELRTLAEGIITMQRKEIGEMNSFRRRHFGAPVSEHGGGGPGHPG